MEKDSPSWRTTKSLFIRRSANLGNVSPFSSRGNVFRTCQSTLNIIELCFETTAEHSAIYYLKCLARLSPSLRSRNRPCWHTATSTHFWSSRKTLHCPWKQCTRRFGITGYSVHHQIQSQVQTNHVLYSCVISHWVYQIYKEGGVLNRFSTPRRHFQTPWSERTHCMENGQSIFLLSPRLVRFAHVRLLRYSNATLSRFWEKTHCFAVFIGKHFKIFYNFKAT